MLLIQNHNNVVSCEEVRTWIIIVNGTLLGNYDNLRT